MRVHPPWLVAVTVAVSVIVSWPARGADFDPAGYERVLVPVYTMFDTLPGAFGSLWTADLRYRNDSSDSTPIFQRFCTYACRGGVVEGCRVGATPPHTGGPIAGYSDRLHTGLFVYVGRTNAADVSFQLHVRDLSREDVSFGTEIPVIRESEMLVTRATLLNAPTDDRYRLHLRVYGVRPIDASGEARVRIYAGETDVAIAEERLLLSPGDPTHGGSCAVSGDPPMNPAYGEIQDLRQLLAPERLGQRIRVVVEPLTPDMPFWAMLSVTNNITQQVTTITPQ